MLGLARAADREAEEYDRQRGLVQEKFQRLERKFDLLIQDFNQAKIESRDTLRQWKAYSERWLRDFGEVGDYTVSDRLEFPNLRLADDRLQQAAADLPRLVNLLGSHIEGERDEKTIGLEKQVEKQLAGVRELIEIPVPVVKEGRWTEAGGVRWRVVSARRRARDRDRGVRLATIRFKLEISGPVMKRFEDDAIALFTESGEKLFPVLSFDAAFAYPEDEKLPFGRFLEAGELHTFTAVFEVPDEERDFILRVTDLETRTRNYGYISLRL